MNVYDVFNGVEITPKLLKDLRSEIPGIINWLIEENQKIIQIEQGLIPDPDSKLKAKERRKQKRTRIKVIETLELIFGKENFKALFGAFSKVLSIETTRILSDKFSRN